MKLSSIINKDLIFFDIKSKTREEIYGSLLNKTIQKLSLDLPEDEILDKLLEREDAISIPYEKGFAYPHLRVKDLEDLYISFAVLPQPVRLKPLDIDETQIVIMFLISGNTSDVYLMTIAAISRLLMQKHIFEKLVRTNRKEDFLKVIDDEKIQLKKSITAEDIMQKDFNHVYENDTIEKVLDILSCKQKTFLPVYDSDNRFQGVISAVSLIKKNVPKYMMMLDNFDFLKGFEPFENLVNFEDSLIVKDFLEKPEKTVEPDVPLIQIALSFIKEDTKKIFVVDKSGFLQGVITMKEIVHKILRG